MERMVVYAFKYLSALLQVPVYARDSYQVNEEEEWGMGKCHHQADPSIAIKFIFSLAFPNKTGAFGGLLISPFYHPIMLSSMEIII